MVANSARSMLKRALCASGCLASLSISAPLAARISEPPLSSVELARLPSADVNSETAEGEREIVVTGTLVRGIEPVGNDVRTISSDQVEITGARTTAELLQSIPQLPDSFNNLQFPLGRSSSTIGNRPNLRGLTNLYATGSSTTLVLVDGHRVVGMGVLATVPDPDIVPPAAIERVEIVLDGGSSIYGSDAVAGVMNFVTRRNFDGFKLETTYGIADNLQTANLSATAGTRWQGGSAFVSYNFNDHDALFGRDRDFVRRFPTMTNGIPFPILSLSCFPGNVRRPPVGTVYALPYSTGQAVRDTANQCDDSDGYSFYPREQLHSVFAGATQQVSDSVELDLRGYFLERSNWLTRGGAYLTQPIGPAAFGLPVDSPFRPAYHTSAAPFEVHVLQFALGDDESASVRSGLRSWGLTPSITADLGGKWQLRAFAGYGHSRSTQNSRIVNVAAMQNAIRAGLINPYDLRSSDSRGLSAALDFENYGLTRQHLFNSRAVIDGELLNLPGGSVKVAFGGEFLREKLWSRNGASVPGFAATGYPELTYTANLPGSPTITIRPATGPLRAVRLARNIASAFGEAVVPLLGEDSGRPGIEELTLSVSARYDHYSDVGSTFNPKFGAAYRPLRWLKLRAAWSKSFVAPSLIDGAEAQSTQLTYYPNIDVFLPSPELVANGTWPAPVAGRNTVALITGSAPGLVPQKSKALSFGIEIMPPFVAGALMTASYWKTSFDQGIGAPPFANNALFWGRFPSSITLYPTAEQIADAVATADIVTSVACAPSPDCIYAILDGRKRNIALRKLDGLDFGAHYDRAIGSSAINFDVSASYLLRYLVSPGGGVPFIDIAKPNFSRLKLRASMGARIREFRLAVSINHSSGYRLDPPVGIAPQQKRVSAFNVVNLFAKYDFTGKGLLEGVSLTINVDNLFNQDPPEYREGGPGVDGQFSGYANGSTLGRLLQVGLSRQF